LFHFIGIARIWQIIKPEGWKVKDGRKGKVAEKGR
jgi:hypothetical protein